MDCLAAIRFLRANAAKWHFDVDRLVVGGQVQVVTTAPRLAPKSDGDSPKSDALDAAVDSVPDLARVACPSTHLGSMTPATALRFLNQHGTDDPLISTLQAIGFALAVAAALEPSMVEIDVLPGASRGNAPFETRANLYRIHAIVAAAMR